ncbi:outer membrane protein assembly factor BamE [Serratia sp. 14-2641]|uniref:outer membrane protein assembly factor BamE domain-containing protein n=1 Tax=Serratia sp. 14-2641 TaxID=1841657 RepID=UPI00080FA04A|nr:outer membrane protein assembly factor BamE [Serratia sp. 14-2641]OCJ43355.1 hypothetical protein A6U95_19925 [Serratia sp. 14-2641]
MKMSKCPIVFMFFLLVGCASNVDRTKVTVLDQYTEKTIKESLIVGSTTKKDVIKLLGRPNSPEDYNGRNVWLYNSKKTDRRVIFLIPVINDRNQVLELTFNDAKILKDMKYQELKQ